MKRSPIAAANPALRVVARCACALLCAAMTVHGATARADDARRIIVALAEKPDLAPSAASTPHGYDGLPNYNGSLHASSDATRFARDYGLAEISAWTIAPLHLRCMLYEIPTAATREEVLQRVQLDRRVRLAEPLQTFHTFGAAPHPPVEQSAAPPVSGYNDPYVGLQRGFAEIDAATAQQWSSGAGVRIALIDSGVDSHHPDLDGRIAERRDFAADTAGPADEDRHGTEVAGVIAAVANNHVGIVGVAPQARLLSYRACRSLRADADAAECTSFTLALALGAAIDADARIINLSLGGPADPLLAQLTGFALTHGAIVVGAMPPGGHADGFPAGVPGVIVVADSAESVATGTTLGAPGHDVLTLEPGGHYDYVNGSSFAAAHVSGAIALLLQLSPRLDGTRARALLARGVHGGASIDVCAAMRALRGGGNDCTAVAATGDDSHARP